MLGDQNFEAMVASRRSAEHPRSASAREPFDNPAVDEVVAVVGGWLSALHLSPSFRKVFGGARLEVEPGSARNGILTRGMSIRSEGVDRLSGEGGASREMTISVGVEIDTATEPRHKVSVRAWVDDPEENDIECLGPYGCGDLGEMRRELSGRLATFCARALDGARQSPDAPLEDAPAPRR
jgi:hypothetical protein